MEGSGRGLIRGTVSEFAWRNLVSTKDLSRDDRSSGPDLNAGRPALCFRRCSVQTCIGVTA
jgi:hypothetical protein